MSYKDFLEGDHNLFNYLILQKNMIFQNWSACDSILKKLSLYAVNL